MDGAYPAELRDQFTCSFRLVSSNELNAPTLDLGTAVTLYLHRVTIDPHLRNASEVVDGSQERTPISLNLHYLLTVWADSSLVEQTILGWVVRQMWQHEALSQSDLTPMGGWRGDEIVQVVPGEISNEDMMRIWDALEPAYRISLSYVARVVQIDPEPRGLSLPVVARRFEVEERAR